MGGDCFHPSLIGRARENCDLLDPAHRAALEGLLGEETTRGWPEVVAMAAGPEQSHFLTVVTSILGPCPGWLSCRGGCPS
jgi:hypothetical protein